MFFLETRIAIFGRDKKGTRVHLGACFLLLATEEGIYTVRSDYQGFAFLFYQMES